MADSWRQGSYRAGAFALGAACLALPAQGCTAPSFADADAEVDQADAGDPPRLDAAIDGEDAAELDAELGELDGADAVPAPERDASSDDAGSPDSEAAPGRDAASADDAAQSALPAWAQGLPGTYAKRSVTFSYDESLLPSGGNTRNVEYSIVDIAPRGGELEVSIQLCDFAVSVENPSVAPISFKHAADTPPMTGRLVLDASESFSSEPMLLHLGFDPARGNTCDASGRREKFAEQAWITGATCRCSAAALPTSTDDCRVIDGDGDGNAGITARAQYLPPLSLTDIALVFDVALTFVDGRVSANRRHELRELRAQAVACINAAVDYCDAGNNELCPGGSARLIPLAPQATCAQLNQGDFGPLDPFPIEVDCRGVAP